MADARTTLKVAPRADFGSRNARRMRREGLVPGVVYSGGSEATAFQVSERDVRNVIAEGHTVDAFKIDRWARHIVEGDIVPAVVRISPLRACIGFGSTCTIDGLPAQPATQMVTNSPGCAASNDLTRGFVAGMPLVPPSPMSTT